MQLLDEYEILGKDDNKLRIKYHLETDPSENWSLVFNRTNYLFTSYSIKNTDNIIAMIDISTFYKNGILEKLQKKVDKVTEEVESDNRKLALILEDTDNDSILDNWQAGMIVLHLRGELSYTENNIFIENNTENFPDYKYYIRKIKDNLSFTNL